MGFLTMEVWCTISKRAEKQKEALRKPRSVLGKYFLRTFIGLSLISQAWAQGVFTLQIGSPPSPPTALVSHGDAWRYHKGTNAPQASWQTVADAALDGTWANGNGGIGYADNANETSLCQTLLADMRSNYTTVYLRSSFQITSAVDSNLHLMLTMDWDDGFVAYLDGAEIQRAFAPGAPGFEPPYYTNATGLHESSRGNLASSPQPATTYDLGPVGGRLATGTHVLAILGLNQSAGSSDFIQVADLQLSGASSAVSGGQFLSVVQSNYVVLSGSNTIANSTRVTVNGDDAASNQAQGTWSKTQALVPGVNQLFIAALDNTGAVLAFTNRMIVSELSSTSVGGTLASNTVWNSSMGIIRVTNTVVVSAGDSLTIDPGTVLLLSPGASVVGTNSAISAAGTSGTRIYFLPADGTTVWGELAMSGTGGTLLLQHIETIAGSVEVLNGATGTLEDSYFHDYEVSSPAIIHTLGLPNRVTLNLRRCHVAHYYEVLSQYATSHIEDCLLEYLGNSGDGIDFDAGQPGSYIRHCTVRRGLLFNTDALDMGEYGSEGSRGILIDSCLLHDFVDKGVSMGVGVDVTVTNTLIYDVDSGIAVKDNSIAGIYNCTIADCNFGFHGYNKASPASPSGGGHITNSFNNILWNISTSLSLSNGSTLTATFSDLQATNYPGAGNFDSNPLFLNAAARDYRLADNSPARGAGVGGANLGVTLPVGGIPGTPLALAALVSGTNPVVLVWTDDADNEDAFVIEHSIDSAAWQTLVTVGANVASYTDDGAVLGQKYYYRLKATNSSGDSAYSNIAAGGRQSAQVFVGGAIAANTIWESAAHYIITNTVAVNAGATLTIQPGAVVCFDTGQSMTIANGGRLLAEGASNAPIRFVRSPSNTTSWGGLTVNGSVGSPETRIAYAYFEGNGNTCIEVAGGTLYLDHASFGTTTHQYVSLDGSSFLISHCHFPSTTTQFELLHGAGGIKSGGRGIVRDSFFGSTTGYNDIIDFTGGNRDQNQPILQIYRNVFVGASDDILDLDGTDAWVEGNIFLHVHKNGSPDSASAVSGGNAGSDTSEVTVIGNLFFDCDQAATAKQGNFFTLINNTIIHTTRSGGSDTASGVVNVRDLDPSPTTFAAGFYLEGNVIADAEQLVRNYDVAQTTVTFSNNIVPFAWNGPGGGNRVADPLLKHIPQLSETAFTNWSDAQIMWDWFGLLSGSPALSDGPNGRDMGGVVPLGASLSGEPNSTTSQTGATLTVGVNRTGNGIPTAGWPNGSGHTHYRWRLDTNAWSAEIAIDVPVTLSALSDGSHFVEIIGRNDAGFYQDDAAFGEDAAVTRSRTWTVQTSVPPAITQQPLSQTVNAGETVTFAVSATGTPPPSYQWRASWVPGDIPGATNDVLILTNIQPALAGNYRVVVSNSAGTNTSDIAVLTVNTNTSLRLGSFVWNTNGLFEFRITGPANTDYVIEATTNFAAWTPLATSSVPVGILEFADPGSTNFPHRFYRVTTP
jgi:hypothetical protein